MKILNLHLMAFGPFTDLDLDFTGNRADLQIIYGPNEAGKSSALRALTGWLFGIEHNSPDNFIHEYQQLKIGGTLRNAAGQELAFIRRKGRSNTVLTPEGKPLDDDIFKDYLQGIDRQVFLSMFGIDHQALVSGGEDILRGGGELGQSLFAAGLGTADLRGVIQELEDKARALFLPRGQLQVINQAISEYAVHKKTVSDQSLRSRDWIEKDQAVERPSPPVGEDFRRPGRYLRRKTSPGTPESGDPQDGEKRCLDAQADKPGQCGASKSGVHRGQERVDAPAEICPRKSGACRQRKARDWRKNSSGLNVPQELLNQAQTITALHQTLGAYQKAAQDLPGLKGTARQLQADASLLLADLYPGLALEDAEWQAFVGGATHPDSGTGRTASSPDCAGSRSVQADR